MPLNLPTSHGSLLLASVVALAQAAPYFLVTRQVQKTSSVS